MRSSMEYRTRQSNPLERKSRYMYMHAARETSNLFTFLKEIDTAVVCLEYILYRVKHQTVNPSLWF